MTLTASRTIPPANIRLDILTDLVQSAQIGLKQFVASLGHELSFDRSDVRLAYQMPEGRIVTMLGYVGHIQGGLSLVMDEASFEVLFRTLSGGLMEPSLDDPVVISASGEMLNMIGGQMIMQLAERGYSLDLTPPQIFLGDTIRPVSISTNRHFILPYRIVGAEGKLFFTVMALRHGDNTEA